MRGIKKSHSFFFIRYSKVQKFLNFEKCLLVIFPWAGKFSTKKDFSLDKENFPQKRFPRKRFFPVQVNFPIVKVFLRSKEFF